MITPLKTTRKYTHRVTSANMAKSAICQVEGRNKLPWAPAPPHCCNYRLLDILPANQITHRGTISELA